jgi:hypothetical protein
MARVIHAQLTPQAREVLRLRDGGINRAGRTLRDWLVHSFETTATSRDQQASLFAETIPVDDDVPLLLEALARVTRRTPDDLVEAWALEEPTPEESAGQAQTTTRPVSLPDDMRGKVIELPRPCRDPFRGDGSGRTAAVGELPPKVRKPRAPLRSSIVPCAVSLDCQQSRPV